MGSLSGVGSLGIFLFAVFILLNCTVSFFIYRSLAWNVDRHNLKCVAEIHGCQALDEVPYFSPYKMHFFIPQKGGKPVHLIDQSLSCEGRSASKRKMSNLAGGGEILS